MSWLKHAFAVEETGPCEPSEAQRGIVDRVCREVVRRHLTTPALVFLEMSRPLNYLGSQTLHFFRPILATMLDTRGIEEFARFLEHRGSVEYLQQRLEAMEAACPEAGSGAPRTIEGRPTDQPGPRPETEPIKKETGQAR